MGTARGDWVLASERVAAALAVSESVGDRGNRPLYLGALADVERAAGRLGASARLGREAADLAAELGHAEWTCWAERMLGVTLLEMGELERSAERLRRAVDAGRASGARVHLILAAAALARVDSSRRDRASAAALGREVRGLLDEITVPTGRAWLFGWPATTDLAAVLVQQGRGFDAIRLVDTLIPAATAAGWLDAVASSLLAKGRALEAEGATDEAVAALRLGVATAEDAGMPLPAWRGHAALAAASGSEHHAEQARRIGLQLAESIEDQSERAVFLEFVEAHLADGGGGGGGAAPAGKGDSA